MSIKSFLTFAFVALILVPLFFTGGLFLLNAREIQTQDAVASLESIGASEKARLRLLLENHNSIVDSIASRTRFRTLLAEHKETGDTNLLPEVARILNDALASQNNVFGGFILGTDSDLLYTSLKSLVTDEVLRRIEEGEGHIVPPISSGQNGIYVVGNIERNGVALGKLVLVFAPTDLLSPMRSYEGLRETGETIIAYRDKQGNAHFFGPRRFAESQTAENITSHVEVDAPIIRAINGEEVSILRANDYRGVEVIASTFFIEETGWGMVVKVDRSEAFISLKQLALVGTSILLIVVVFALSIGYLMSRAITKPIVELTQTSTEAANTDGTASIPETIQSVPNEVGTLARAFSKLLVSLKEAQGGLEEKVRLRTKEAEEANKKLAEKLEETERLNKVMVGREIKMAELKEKLKQYEN